MVRLNIYPTIILCAALLLAACTPVNENGQATQAEPALASTLVPVTGAEYPNGQYLASIDWLAERLDDPDLRILDIRESADYAAGHIPGAVHVPLDSIVSSVDGVPFEFDEAGVQQALSQAGLMPDTPVVIYDDLGMMNAARLFWTLEYVGHQDARVLNGGWNAWVAGGGEQSDGVESPEATDYPIRLDADKLVTADELVTLLDDPAVAIVDARSPQEYSGEVRLAERGGHIPGAVNLVWLDVLEGGDTVYTIESGWQEQLKDEDEEHLKSAEAIQALLDERGISPDQEVITYCQTLWRGAHTYFVLRLMGYEQVRGYDASWAEWGSRDDLPVEESP